MPKNSIADVIMAWETALTNAKMNATDVPGIDGYTAPLEQMLDQAKALSAGLASRYALKQQDSRDRKTLIQEGNVQVSRLRLALKAFYGPHSERIIEYGGRPIRPRTNKKPTVPEVPPPTPAPTPGPEAGTGAPATAPVTPTLPAAPAAPAKAAQEHEAPRNPTTL
jgi:hypothetical protein